MPCFPQRPALIFLLLPGTNQSFIPIPSLFQAELSLRVSINSRAHTHRTRNHPVQTLIADWKETGSRWVRPSAVSRRANYLTLQSCLGSMLLFTIPSFIIHSLHPQ
ncbi:hypothetical protein LZ32DRAFT_174778 [Colletotrichum eremochloae]|nr:hypothetical protein LZ32DRAFT_174778 [Colletotrichum eremochloae]